ncbi:MAG: glycosyltransferase [Pirellulales bacterium]|nr:glycosyltransferase [Pirellulales bacterium]
MALDLQVDSINIFFQIHIPFTILAMNIVMFTNTYFPHVGGVARSVKAFSDEYHRLGHRVLVIAPQFDGAKKNEKHTIRVPAIQNFNGSDFSVRLPIPGYVTEDLDDFKPDLIHSHHPFLLGDSALRAAARKNLPLVFTHHTMYERYTHYVPGESKTLRRYVVDLSTGYANLCNRVFAPSESIATVLRERGVETPIKVVPTGVDPSNFTQGDSARIREEFRIPASAYVVGHVGRLAPEKNLEFLARAVTKFMRRSKKVHFLVIGSGPSEGEIQHIFIEGHCSSRLHFAGTRQGQDLIDAYHAMDVFAFASQTETQGIVLTEAMAAGLPVVALNAPGAREVVCDGQNGRLVKQQDVGAFADALQMISHANENEGKSLSKTARDTAESFSMSCCAQKALEIYDDLIASHPIEKPEPIMIRGSNWESALRVLEAEWNLWSVRAHAAGIAITSNI